MYIDEMKNYTSKDEAWVACVHYDRPVVFCTLKLYPDLSWESIESPRCGGYMDSNGIHREYFNGNRE
jgi:hypothetical protein